MREFFIKLEDKIKTKSDLIFYLENIDLAMEILMKNYNDSLLEKLKENSFGYLGNILLELSLNKSFKDNEQQIYFLQFLKKHILLLKQIKLEISFYPEDEMIDKITNWLQKELGVKIIIDLIINPRIVGGAVIEHNGKIIDFSIAKEIKKMEIKIPN